MLVANSSIVSGISIAVSIVSLATTIGVYLSQQSLRRRFRKWKGIHETADLEAVYHSTIDEVQLLKEENAELRKVLWSLQAELQGKVSTAKVMRYNAFADQGSDLSFSIALLDDEKNGVVLSSIYGRDESRTYAKPIRNGSSDYPLTDEETYVINTNEVIDTSRSKSVVHS